MRSCFSKLHFAVICLALVAFQENTKAFSLAEFSYSLAVDDCPKSSDRATHSTINKLCGFFSNRTPALTLQSTIQEIESNHYFAALAKMRADELACAEKKLDFINSNEDELNFLVENYAQKLVLLGNEYRLLQTLKPAVGRDPKATEQYKLARLRSEALLASMPFAGTNRMRNTILALVNQTDQFPNVQDWFYQQIKSDLKKSLKGTQKEILENKKRMQNAVASSGTSLRRVDKESLAQDQELVEAFRQTKTLPDETHKGVACRADAEFGRGAEIRDQSLMALTFLGSAGAGLLVKAGQAGLRSSLVGAAALGRISHTAGAILKPLAFAAGTSALASSIQVSCLNEGSTLTAKSCQIESIASTGPEDCVLFSVLDGLGIAKTVKSSKEAFDYIKQNSTYGIKKFEPLTLGDSAQEFDANEGVRYLAKSRAKFKVTIRDGKLYNANGRPVDTTVSKTHQSGEGHAMFVMDTKGNIYVSPFQKVGRFHHSSLVGGEPVAMAGEIKVVNGQIVAVSRKSGHYKPSEKHQDQFLEYLKDRGVKNQIQKIRSLW